jgi:multidrug efflux pump subunit AcrB
VHVQVNPLALASRGIGLEDVHTALNNATLDEPKGNLENAHQQVTIDTNDQLFGAQSFRRDCGVSPWRASEAGKTPAETHRGNAPAWRRAEEFSHLRDPARRKRGKTGGGLVLLCQNFCCLR